MRVLPKASFTAICFVLVASAAVAQQRVHALSGTITSINSKIRMIEVDTDDGSSGHFDFLKAGTAIEFDKSVSADATAADKFTADKTHAIVYFVGQGDVRSAVALRSLGDGQLKTTTGTVVRFNRHDHVLIIKGSSGTEESFAIDAKTVADTETGVSQSFKFDFNKGKAVRVTALTTNGNATALLIVPVM
jgi:hypothetical protein